VSLLGLSEAAALAMHATALLAGSPDRPLTTKEMAAELEASEGTLAKAIQDLRKAGIVKTTRGPSGGATLLVPPGELSLRRIYEAIEGPLKIRTCMFDEPICGKAGCVMGHFLEKINREVVEKFDETTLADFRLEKSAT